MWLQYNSSQANSSGKDSQSNYLIFTRSRQEFATRLTVNNKLIERQEHVQLLGVWLQPDGGWGKQVNSSATQGWGRCFNPSTASNGNMNYNLYTPLYKVDNFPKYTLHNNLGFILSTIAIPPLPLSSFNRFLSIVKIVFSMAIYGHNSIINTT